MALYTTKLFKWQMKEESWNYGDVELLHKSFLVLGGDGQKKSFLQLIRKQALEEEVRTF